MLYVVDEGHFLVLLFDGRIRDNLTFKINSTKNGQPSQCSNTVVVSNVGHSCCCYERWPTTPPPAQSLQTFHSPGLLPEQVLRKHK